MNIIGILKDFISEVHTRPTYSDFCLSIGVVLFIGIVPYKAVIDGESTLNGGISFHKYDQTGWGENPDNKNIGIIDHSLGSTLATLTPLDNGTIVWDNGTAVSMDNGTALSVDLTDKITSYGEEYSIALRVLETTDKVIFFIYGVIPDSSLKHQSFEVILNYTFSLKLKNFRII